MLSQLQHSNFNCAKSKVYRTYLNRKMGFDDSSLKTLRLVVCPFKQQRQSSVVVKCLHRNMIRAWVRILPLPDTKMDIGGLPCRR